MSSPSVGSTGWASPLTWPRCIRVCACVCVYAFAIILCACMFVHMYLCVCTASAFAGVLLVVGEQLSCDGGCVRHLPLRSCGATANSCEASLFPPPAQEGRRATASGPCRARLREGRCWDRHVSYSFWYAHTHTHARTHAHTHHTHSTLHMQVHMLLHSRTDTYDRVTTLTCT